MLGRDFGRLQAGLGVDVLLLGTEVRWRNDFPDVLEDDGFTDSDDLDETNLHGLAWRAGVRVPVGQWLSLGGWTSLPTELSGEHRLQSQQTGEEGDVVVDVDADFAPIYALGLEVTVPEVTRSRSASSTR